MRFFTLSAQQSRPNTRVNAIVSEERNQHYSSQDRRTAGRKELESIALAPWASDVAENTLPWYSNLMFSDERAE